MLTHQGMYDLAVELYPICRSLTGAGVRETLEILRRELPDLTFCQVPSGTRCFDWTVPDEWNIRDAYLLGPGGETIVDFKRHNLHIMGYSVPVDKTITLDELQPHLYSLPDQPDAIPYITSYYNRHWGFCLSYDQRAKLEPGSYRAVIDSTLQRGVLDYGELILPGRMNQEVLLSTYVCHPSMGNNELSGPVVTTALAQFIAGMENRRLTYRIVFIPETIGSIVYLSSHLAAMKRNAIAGFVVTCVGDNRDYSFLPSRNGNTLADKVARHVLRHHAPDFKTYSFLDRGSDERQYCSVGADLPVASVMRTKYAVYPEYHTSLDDLNLISPEGLGGAFDALKKCVLALERNAYYRVTCTCEPQLGKRGLYPTVSTKETGRIVRVMKTILAYADGTHDLIDIAELLNIPVEALYGEVDKLLRAGLLERVEKNEAAHE